MNKKDEHIKLSDTLTLSEMHDGFWLWDKTRGVNLSMRAKTKDIAFVEAITYYQKRLKEVENKLKRLDNAIYVFTNSIADDDKECYD